MRKTGLDAVERLRAPTLFQKAARGYMGIVVLLAFCAAALVYEAYHLGLTIDEPSHFAAGYAYWLGQDVLVPPDTPPLTRIISGWVPLVFGAPKPHELKRWASQDAYLIGPEIFRKLTRAHRVLFYTRLPFLAFPVLIVFLIWRWGRELFGDGIAILLALCGALEPTLFGHGALIKSDVAATFGALWFAYTAWSYWRSPTRGRLAIMTLSVLVALLAKFTLLPVAFVAYGLALWKGPRLLAAIALPAALYLGILAASRFQAQPVPQQEIDQFTGAGVPEWALPEARLLARLPWPLQFVRGVIFIGSSLRGNGFTGYMLGQTIHGRVAAYFPLAWDIKFPIPLQALTVAGLMALLVRVVRRQVCAAEILIWGSAAFYFGTAVLSNFHIGFRHVLPALPFFILGGGFALERWAGSGAGRTVVVLALFWLAFSSVNIFPQGLSYFNEWIGGPINGWRYLADSNLDWGQNLPELGVYLKRNHIETVNSFLFSSDGMSLPPGSLAPQPWPPAEAPPGLHFRPQPGVYAVSANLLAGFLYPPGREDYLECFRQRRPDARAGYSILIYDVK